MNGRPGKRGRAGVVWRWTRRLLFRGRRAIVGLLLVTGLLLAAMVAFAWQVQARTASAIYSWSDPLLPHNHVALVFGAGLSPNGDPSPLLADRIATAVDLYRAHKADKLLMTGDNSRADYNEVGAMRRAAVALGVPERDIVLDYAGFRTYDSCYRAGAVFGVTAATLVTNAFHLPRALYTCEQLGLSVVGVPADRTYQISLYNQLRELPALASTGMDLVMGAQPHFLGPHVDVDAPPFQP